MMTLQQNHHKIAGAPEDVRGIVSSLSRLQIQRGRSTESTQSNEEVTLEICLFGEADQSAQLITQLKTSEVMKQLSNSSSKEMEADDDKVESSPEDDDNDDDDGSTHSAHSIDELAPVDSKWAECSTDHDSSRGLRIAPPHCIDIKQLRKIVAAGGIMEDAESGRSHRAVAWRVLASYLGVDTETWHEELLEKRNLYIELVSNLFDDTTDVMECAEELVGVRNRPRNNSITATSLIGNNKAKKTVIPPHIKHYWKSKLLDINVLDRLSKDLNALKIKAEEEQSKDADADVTKNSTEQAEKANVASKGIDKEDLDDFVESVLLLDEIRKDVVRTHPDLSFFLEPYRNLGRRRYAALERILFVWSKYNKGVRYVQGMNEIVGIIYYVLANDQHEEWATWAEADTYWLFHVLLAEMSDVFVPGLDNHDTGIQGRINDMHMLLGRHDPEVREHMDEIGIEVSFYAIRWWTTLLSREFLLPDTIRLWDSMFASTHKDNFLRYVCVTMVMLIRDSLLKSDFSQCMKLLHSFPSTSIDRLLEASRALWIYESQVSVACHRGGLSLHQALTTIDSPPALIMAYGFPNGTPPVSRAEQLERAKEMAESTVRNAAHGVFGRARGLYNRYSKEAAEYRKERSNSTDGALALGSDKKVVNLSPAAEKEEADDDVYLQAILKQV